MVKINCDMCGGKSKLFKAMIENVEMNVCVDCSRFGKVIGEVKEMPKRIEKIKKEKPDVEVLQVIVEDYSEKIKKARENLGLGQKDLAKKLNLKESLMHKIETGSFEPNLSLARELEKFLKIKLIEQHEEVYKKESKSKNNSFTIGDFIKVK